MKKTSLIAEMDVPDVFNDKCIRDLAATAKLMLTAAKFDAFKNAVRHAVIIYLRELRVPSHNQLHREVKALELAASYREYEKVADLLEKLSTETRASLNERCGRGRCESALTRHVTRSRVAGVELHNGRKLVPNWWRLQGAYPLCARATPQFQKKGCGTMVYHLST